MLRISPFLGALLACVACGGGDEKTLTGAAPDDAARVLVIDSAGVSHVSEGAGDFEIALDPGTTAVLFVERTDGTLAPLVFDNGHGTQSVIPDFAGKVKLGALSLVDGASAARVAATGDTGADVTTESEENPLDQVDSDDDGDSDLEDSDDDEDGEDDESDDDADGDGEDDHDGDFDHDDDGDPDLSDDDDDNDGVEDDEDEDHGDDDEDGDGVDDEHDDEDEGTETEGSETETETGTETET